MKRYVANGAEEVSREEMKLPDNAMERTVKHPGPRLCAAESSRPPAQLNHQPRREGLCDY
jgi:hypothetical protein